MPAMTPKERGQADLIENGLRAGLRAEAELFLYLQLLDYQMPRLRPQ